MVTKDYYKILELTPSATNADIKKSFRRLALKYHPDHNFGNQLYEAKFKEIKEAYEVLSDLKQRQDYNYKNYGRAQAEKKKTTSQVTPYTILNQIITYRKKVSILDPDRMNKFALFQQVQQLLSKSNIAILQQNYDTRVNKRIIEEIILCSRFLPPPQVERICFQLTALAGTDNTMYQKIYNFSREVRLREQWNKYKVFAAVIIGILLCFLIYVLSTI